jgi:hypothetical protein
MNNLNDLETRAKTYAQFSEDQDPLVSGAARLFMVSITSGVASGLATVHDTTGAFDNPVVNLRAALHDTNTMSFYPNGIRLGTGMTVNLSGTPDSCTVLYTAE